MNDGIMNQTLLPVVTLTLMGIYGRAVYWKPCVSRAKTKILSLL